MKPVTDSTMDAEEVEEEEEEGEEDKRVENGWFIPLPHLLLIFQHLSTSQMELDCFCVRKIYNCVIAVIRSVRNTSRGRRRS